ncbi:hypothetical protein [Bradyrhizobium jicamae]|uniref:hypothetical protein n=1 Tax=Bradyrhizobium jicamae TaxID=280332 RepID=UPI0012ED60F4|nr:hypothetical protein [Bradyrhizobium jicamae]
MTYVKASFHAQFLRFSDDSVRVPAEGAGNAAIGDFQKFKMHEKRARIEAVLQDSDNQFKRACARRHYDGWGQ